MLFSLLHALPCMHCHVSLLPGRTQVALCTKEGPNPDPNLDPNPNPQVALCTEGSSLVPLMKDPKTAIKQAAFSQYPRGYQSKDANFNAAYYEEDVSGTASTSPCIESTGKGCTMGYTLVTRASDGCEYRYTEWADFNTEGFAYRVNWERNVGSELYNHTADPGENVNLAGKAGLSDLKASLSKMLRAGPKFGN